MALTPNPEDPGESLNDLPRYFADHEILDEIARGGMGVVYRARRLGIDREVALKVVRTGSLATPDARMRFTMEVEAISRLRHPNIITLYETGEAEEVHFFSMPLCEGTLSMEGDLREQIHSLKKITSAVHYAHSRGILHRDIKPSNILIDPDGEPVLSDFGLVKHLGEESSVTLSRTVVGSPRYMAPEQESKSELSTAADIYSLGAVLHEILAGAPPDDSSFTPNPRRKNAAIPRDLAAICLQCLEKEPKKRYASAAELEGDLQSWLEGSPVKARPRSALDSLWLWSRRKPALAAMLATCFLLLLTIAIGASIAALRISEANKLASSRLQILQLEQIENLEMAGRGIEAIPLLEAYVDNYPSDKAAKSHLLSSLGHRNFPKRIGERRRIFSKVRAAIWKDELITLTANGVFKDQKFPACQKALLNPTGNKALLFTNEGTVIFWEEGEELVEFPKIRAVRNWSVSPDWSQLAVVHTGKEMTLWSLPEGSLIKTVTRPNGFIKVAFSPDGRRIVTSNQEGELLLWMSDTMAFTRLPQQRWRNISALEFSSDSKLLATGDQKGGIQIYSLKNGTPLSPVFQHGNRVYDLDFSPDNSLLSSGAETNSARIWQVTTGQPHCEAAKTTVGVQFVKLLDDQLITIAQDGFVATFEIRPPPLSAEPKAFGINQPVLHQYGHWSFASFHKILQPTELSDWQFGKTQPWRTSVSPDGKHLAISTYAREIEIWNLETKSLIHTLPILNGVIRALVFHPTKNQLAIVNRDEGILIWDLDRQKPAAPSPKLPSSSIDFTFNKDGSRYLTCTARRVLIFETESGKLLWQKSLKTYVSSSRFSPDGKHAITSCGDGLVYLWKIDSDQAPRTLKHGHSPFHTAFSPDGRIILTAGFDNTVRLWDAESLRPVSTRIPTSGKLTGAGFKADGSGFVTSTTDRYYREWAFPEILRKN